jgi:imidazolonepropionase-like amidohydrolase
VTEGPVPLIPSAEEVPVSSGHDERPEASDVTAVTAVTVLLPDRVIDSERSEVLTDRAVIVDGDRIASVVATADAPSDAHRIDLAGHTLLSGLSDMHAHLVGQEDNGQGYAGLVMRTGAQDALAGVKNARATLDAGFTTVRDVGTFRAFVDVALRGPSRRAGSTVHGCAARARTSRAPAAAVTSPGSRPTSTASFRGSCGSA